MNLWKRFVRFYQARAENRTQVKLFLGFVVIPAIGFTLLFIYVMLYWLPKSGVLH